jgi:predicted RNase H-like HicB family nuclease
VELPAALAYGDSREEALAKAEAVALRAIADRLEHGERAPALNHCSKPFEPVALDAGASGTLLEFVSSELLAR